MNPKFENLIEFITMSWGFSFFLIVYFQTAFIEKLILNNAKLKKIRIALFIIFFLFTVLSTFILYKE